MNKVKPTKKQAATFKHLATAKSLQEAMLKGGYSKVTSTHPKHNFIDSKGVKPLIEQYRDAFISAGISIEVLAEIEAEGLFDSNAAVRLGYLKESKKTLGIVSSESQPDNLKSRTIAEEFFND